MIVSCRNFTGRLYDMNTNVYHFVGENYYTMDIKILLSDGAIVTLKNVSDDELEIVKE